MWENVSNHCKINGNFESQNKIEWLKVLKQLSFSKCGQEALLKFLIPGPSLSELIDIMESFSIEFQEVVVNNCCCNVFKFISFLSFVICHSFHQLNFH